MYRIGPSKLSRRAQHNEVRYFVKRCSRRHMASTIGGRTDMGNADSPRKDFAGTYIYIYIGIRARDVTRI